MSELSERDEAGNVVQGDAIIQDTRNTYVHSEDRVVAAVGVTDLVIVDTADAVLVADKNAAQDVKKVVGAARTRRSE